MYKLLFFYRQTRPHNVLHFGGALKDWEISNYAWQEHAERSPKCILVVHIKSAGFVLDNASRLKIAQALLIIYILTPWCRVLLEKLTGLQLVKKFPAFHGTRRFITALTTVRHLVLSWASPIQSIYPHPTSWRSNPTPLYA